MSSHSLFILLILALNVYMRIVILIFVISLFTISLQAACCTEGPFELWGTDSEWSLSEIKRPRDDVHAGQKICASMIRFFQVYISPIDGPRSSFYPTSSQYALEAIKKYGVFKGIALGCDRLMRENKELWVYRKIDGYGIRRKHDPVR